jgi:hypothetical protein
MQAPSAVIFDCFAPKRLADTIQAVSNVDKSCADTLLGAPTSTWILYGRAVARPYTPHNYFVLNCPSMKLSYIRCGSSVRRMGMKRARVPMG